MYCRNLGEILAPEPRGDDWVSKITYRPEPPAAFVRGGMNPWDTERKRVVRLTEDTAWAKILTLQGKFRKTYGAFMERQYVYNAKIAELDALSGGASGLIKAKGVVGMIASPINMVTGLFDSILSLLTGGLFGGIFGGSAKKKKKKKMEEIIGDLQQLQPQLQHLQNQLIILYAEAERVMGQGNAARLGQASIIARDMESMNTAVLNRKELDAKRGAALQALNVMATTFYPSRQRSPDAL